LEERAHIAPEEGNPYSPFAMPGQQFLSLDALNYIIQGLAINEIFTQL